MNEASYNASEDQVCPSVSRNCLKAQRDPLDFSHFSLMSPNANMTRSSMNL